jgi:hypothetical protein
MGLYPSRPQYQQPLVVTQQGPAGQAGQTTVVYGAPTQPQPYGYGYEYGYSPGLMEVALVADVITDIAIIDALTGGKKKNKKEKKEKNISKSKSINKNKPGNKSKK